MKINEYLIPEMVRADKQRLQPTKTSIKDANLHQLGGNGPALALMFGMVKPKT